MAINKKPSTGKPEQGKDTTDAFFKKLKAKGSMLKKAGTEKAPAGYTTTGEIIEAFKLKIGGKTTTSAKCTGARCGVDKNENLYVSFNFVCTGETGKGQTPGKYISLVAQGDRTEEQAYKDLAFTLQRMGYDTSDLSIDTLKSILDQVKQDRPSVSITINRYGESGISVQVNRPIDDEESDDSDDDTSDEDEEDDSDEEDTETDDDSEEDSDEEGSDDDSEEDDLEDPPSWVGQKATVKTAKMTKAGKVTLLSYNEKTKVFKAKTTKGEALTVKLAEVQEIS